MLAHELRNPLCASLYALEALRLQGAERGTVERTRALLDRQIRNMARLIEDLLDHSRIGLGKRQLSKRTIDLTEVVAHAVETARPLITSRQHQLEVSVPEDPVPVEGDPTRLQQIVANLLTNAAKYTEPDGRIGLQVEPVEDEVLVRVRDTGIGIAPELLPRIFDLFVQARSGSQEGLGIGL